MHDFLRTHRASNRWKVQVFCLTLHICIAIAIRGCCTQLTLEFFWQPGFARWRLVSWSITEERSTMRPCTSCYIIAHTRLDVSCENKKQNVCHEHTCRASCCLQHPSAFYDMYLLIHISAETRFQVVMNVPDHILATGQHNICTGCNLGSPCMC